MKNILILIVLCSLVQSVDAQKKNTLWARVEVKPSIVTGEEEEKAKKIAAIQNNKIYSKPTVKALFDGGEAALVQLLLEKFRPYYGGITEMQTKVRIFVKKTGKVERIYFVSDKDVDPLNQAAEHLVADMPFWLPAEMSGIQVDSIYTLPLVITAESQSTPQLAQGN
jgi:hypothetical protein